MKFFPSITTGNNSNWREKIKEADFLRLEEVAIFPTFLDRIERKSLYDLIERSSIKRIPLVHLREDMTIEELDFLVDKYETKVFNTHSSREFNIENQWIVKYGKMIYIENTHSSPLDSDEIKKLIEYLENRVGKDYVNDYVLLFVKLSLSTGARLMSVQTITKADVNLKQETIIIKNHKSNRTYTAHIHPTLKPLLEKRMKDLSPIDYILSGSPTPMNRTTINKVLQPIFNELFNQGLASDDYKRRVVIHTLRHTFASLLAINGTPIYTIKKLMDHSDINQTMRYAKLQPEAGASAVKGLDI